MLTFVQSVLICLNIAETDGQELPKYIRNAFYALSGRAQFHQRSMSSFFCRNVVLPAF